MRPNNVAPIKLLAFHCAGGGLANFRKWLNITQNVFEISVIVLPGREHRFNEPFCKDMTILITAICNEIEPLLSNPDQVYILFGHSLGGLIGFEVIREMRRRNFHQLKHLIVSATRAPHLDRPKWLTTGSSAIQNQETLRLFNGTSQDIMRYPELVELLSSRLEADCQLYASYQYFPENPLNCPITILGGKSDPFVNKEDLLAWKKHTIQYLNAHFFEGDHFFIDNNLQEIIDILQKISIDILRQRQIL